MMSKVLIWLDTNVERLANLGLSLVIVSITVAIVCTMAVLSYSLVLWAAHGLPL